MILAFDFGINCGVAWGGDGEPFGSATRCLRGGKSVGHNLLHFRGILSGLVEHLKPRLVVFEKPFASSGRAKSGQVVPRSMGMAGVVMMAGAANNFPVQGFHISTVRKAFAGHGRATEEQIFEACAKRGFAPLTDHEADAYAVLWYALSKQ